MSGETFCGGMVLRIDIRCFEDARGVLSPIDFDPFGFRAGSRLRRLRGGPAPSGGDTATAAGGKS